jgi:hypothetical protein
MTGEKPTDSPREPAPPANGEQPKTAPPGAAPAAGALTPEEQMEQFAKELKENDWGHQPC